MNYKIWNDQVLEWLSVLLLAGSWTSIYKLGSYIVIHWECFSLHLLITILHYKFLCSYIRHSIFHQWCRFYRISKLFSRQNFLWRKGIAPLILNRHKSIFIILRKKAKTSSDPCYHGGPPLNKNRHLLPLKLFDDWGT